MAKKLRPKPPNARLLNPADRLHDAMDRCAMARGEAQYTFGYRAASYEATQDKLWDKERKQWQDVDRAEAAFRRVVQSVLREARRAR